MSWKVDKEPYNFNTDGLPKIYKPNYMYMACPQAESWDRYGTIEDIERAAFYQYEHLKNGTLLFTNAINMLWWIQKGLTKEDYSGVIEKPKGIEIGSSQEIANKVHHTLDWLRAVQKRTWDTRPMNSCERILPYVLKGLYINSATLLHYNENPERF